MVHTEELGEVVSRSSLLLSPQPTEKIIIAIQNGREVVILINLCMQGMLKYLYVLSVSADGGLRHVVL